MLESGRFIYAVFMCHLCIEKAFKGLYTRKLQEIPPKSHDLNYLCDKITPTLSEAQQQFIDKLNDLSVPTRYPDELDKLLKQYDKARVRDIVTQAKELLAWLNRQS